MNRLPDVASLLAEFRPDPNSPHDESVQKAAFLARRLQERAAALQTPAQRRQQAELDRMVGRAADKATVLQMTDEAFRAADPVRAAGHLIHILDDRGIPRCFGFWDRALLWAFRTFGRYAPRIAMPLVRRHVRNAAANVILPGEKHRLTRHLRRRNGEGVRTNVNFLGEAILSEQDAQRRLEQYLDALEWPEIEVVSIKISTLYSQISPLAREHTVAVLCDRLERLFRAAAAATFVRHDGAAVPKFVYLDMEEYRDKDLTAAAFMRTLDRPGLERVRAGIALQSYVPDSFRTLREIQEWARRAAAGGGRITVRLVKGANMEAERVEASLRGWPQAPFQTKRETDANYRRMLLEAMKPENLAAMDIGVASHNLFELAYALVLAVERQALDKVQIEMLEGMADPQRRALCEVCPNVLLYAPACDKGHFVNAVGYFIRRLDENTGPENFLRHAFKLHAGGPEWQQLERGFLAAFDALPTLSDSPRRTQDRRQLSGRLPTCKETSGRLATCPTASDTLEACATWQDFVTEPDTDFSLPQNGAWAAGIIAKWEPLCDGRAPQIPLVIAGEEIIDDRTCRDCRDPSRPGAVVGRYRQAGEADVARAVACAAADADGWRNMPVRERFVLLGRVAQEIRKTRGELMGAALANAGKTLAESDTEVSEAADFLDFYRATARWWQEMPSLRTRPKGAVVVVSPWNFPVAIPCGGVAAALAAGNTVILKPASDAVLVAWELCRCFWRAGVSQRILQFVPCAGAAEGQTLVGHPKVDAVILTGGTETAAAMLRAKPDMRLFAETGGKNATIVTALADRDQAIRHVLHSAFSHSGQKCSATSLLLLEAEIYDDPQFRRALCDAAGSIAVGSAWDLATRMGPLIRPPTGDLQKALTVLETGEEWALRPQNVAGSPNLWSPGIKYGVRPGSYTHQTEFFGPVLGVMRFTTLAEAAASVNQTGYGLTAGLESLDRREWAYWREHSRAGNLYVNRVTTGAVVLRQPFGGFGKSVFGPGMKAGGPNYVAQFMEFTDDGVHECDCRTAFPGRQSRPGKAAQPRRPGKADLQAELQEQLSLRAGELGDDGQRQAARICAAAAGYEQAFREEFAVEHDHFHLIGQDNLRRYRPVADVCVRVHPQDTAFELFARVCAAHTVGSRVTVSSPPQFASPAIELLRELTEAWAGTIEFVEESDEQLADVLRHAHGRATIHIVPDRRATFQVVPGHGPVENRPYERIRYAAADRVPLAVLQAAAENGLCVVSSPVLAEGRLELLWYLHEQSISIDYHRYGNLGSRAGQPRSEPA